MDAASLTSRADTAQPPVAAQDHPRYSAAMPHSVGVLASLMGLIAVSAAILFFPATQPSHQAPGPFWVGFLIGVPAGLLICVRLGFRWALMASVIYCTVGLALDLSTLVQMLTKDDPTAAMLAASGLSGLLNFLVIAFGGRAFLDVSQEPPPPGSHPPSPPFPA